MWLFNRLLAVALLLGLLAGCGFHLRGLTPLPPELAQLHLTAGSTPELETALRDQLRRNGVTLVDAPEGAAVLRVQAVAGARRASAVAAEGDVQRYRLQRSARIALTGADGATLLEEQQVDVFREFTYDPNDLLGKEREEQTLQREMDRELALLITQRLQSVGSRP